MPVVVAPNRTYSGIQANVDFGGGVAHDVPQATEQDKHRLSWFKQRGFKVYMTEEEYRKAEGVQNTEIVEVKESLPPVADEVPPVEDLEEEEDEANGTDNGNTDGDMGGDSDKGTSEGDTKKSTKVSKRKIKK